ncbi:MAG: RtcB family protein [Burkholderiaceae bacterium]|nr:RtcB family protein [Burkholderiaceae bacterium]
MTICKVISDTGAVPVKIWTDDVDVGSIEQLKNVARLPFVFHHVAAMPDVHVGMGATIGSVIATREAVIPAAVGVDIGCGMLAAKTNLRRGDTDTKSLGEAMKSILRRTPVGFQQHKDKNIHWDACRLFEDDLNELLSREPKVLSDMKSRHWTNEMGSLGGGNHFIELSADENDDLWVMLHTGSRGPGNVMASFFIRKAKALAQAAGVELPDWNLASFREGTRDFENYMLATAWAQRYAFVNRQEILADVMKSLADIWPGIQLDGEVINCHHNYVEKEEHFGEKVWVTRKGAIRAQAGEMGIIPGSMGTRSYLVRGLGNAESFNSSSHGAGRKMSRTQAQKAFSVEDLRRQTEGVVCRQDKGVIDEIPGAYKRIEDVMANQTDLTETVHTLKQVLCVKG